MLQTYHVSVTFETAPKNLKRVCRAIATKLQMTTTTVEEVNRRCVSYSIATTMEEKHFVREMGLQIQRALTPLKTGRVTVNMQKVIGEGQLGL